MTRRQRAWRQVCLAAAGAMAALVLAPSTAGAGCDPAAGVRPAATATVVVEDAPPVRQLDPGFFGFNLEWLEFQIGLWDAKQSQVLPEARALLAPFAGAYYRYPGGHNANHLRWTESVGVPELRSSRKQVSWAPEQRVLFGPEEYLQFVKQVGGRPWYVANLQGDLGKSRPVADMAREAGALAQRFQELAKKGLPPVERWELGNELDRAEYQWPPERLAAAADAVAAAIKAVNPQSQFAYLQEEYPAQAAKGYTAERYNKELRERLQGLRADYAIHAYYDGPPMGPPVSYFLKQACAVSDAAHAEGRAAGIWFTEHARVPAGAWTRSDWKDLWPGTADMQAAISVADMTLALANMPEIRGAFVHALHASDGPWPLMVRDSKGNLRASRPMQALGILRKVMGDEVLKSIQFAKFATANGLAPNTRILVMRDSRSRRLSIWLVNRSEKAQSMTIDFPEGFVSGLESGEVLSESGVTGLALANRGGVAAVFGGLEVTRSNSARWKLEIPPSAVVALSWR